MTSANLTNSSNIRALHRASLMEACTLLFLVFVAVPLKHLGGYPLATTIVGPVHGLAFLYFMWVLSRASGEEGWAFGRVMALFLPALLPFGGFFTAWRLGRMRPVNHEQGVG